MSVDTSVLAPATRARGIRLRLSKAGRPTDAPPRLLVRFAIYAGIALLIAAAAGTFLAQRSARVRAEKQVFADASFTADRLGRDDLAKLALRAPITSPERLAELDELFGREALERGVLRVTLFSRSGGVTYSTDHSLIGKPPYDVELVRRALAGEEVHKTARLRGGLGDNPTVLQSYAPVYWYFDEDSSPNGVIGVYRDYGPVGDAIREETVIRSATIIGALLFLYLLSLPILRGVMRTLESRNRQLAEHAEALRVSEEQYRLIVETAAEGVSLLDADGNIVFANVKLAEMIGREVDSLPGTSFVQLMEEHSRATADARWFRRRHEQREFAFLRPDGKLLHASVSANPIFDRDGRYAGALAMVTDLTERKQIEGVLEEMEARLGSSPAQQATRQAGSIARDFDRALTAIAGYSDYLLARLDPDDPLHREATQLRSDASGAIGLTRQLLAISRRESLRTEVIDASSAVEAICGDLPRVLGDSIQLVVACDRSAGRTPADAAQLEQVIVNIALHSKASMPEGGRLVVETRPVEVGVELARTRAPMSPGAYVLISVTDSGPSLGAEEKACLFAPLFTGVDEDAAGLGLATVYGIVKQNEGFIWADDGPGGRGTTFSIYLPRV